jgi:hypothetical protein
MSNYCSKVQGLLILAEYYVDMLIIGKVVERQKCKAMGLWLEQARTARLQKRETCPVERQAFVVWLGLRYVK